MGEQSHLSETANETVLARYDQLFLSVISMWEIAIKVRKGQLQLSKPTEIWIGRGMCKHGITGVSVDSSMAIRSVELPLLHKDPADRIIVATAQLSNLDILTPDRLIAAYPDVTVLW